LYDGMSTTLNFGDVPSSELVFSLYTNSITFPPAPLNSPQSGSKIFPVYTFAHQHTFNIESRSDSFHKHLT